MTESEKNLVTLFSLTDFKLKRIDESEEKSPDFVLHANEQEIFIEVKEIRDNEEEKKLLDEVAKKGHAHSDGDIVGKRFRPKISEANTQLKKRCVNGQPGIVIIQDVRNFFTRSAIPEEEIKQAMFGDRVTWIKVASRQMEQRVAADIYSKNKSTTPAKNTTVSAVGLLIKHIETGVLTLVIYHNPHAKYKLNTRLCKAQNIIEFKMSDTLNYGNFEPIYAI